MGVGGQEACHRVPIKAVLMARNSDWTRVTSYEEVQEEGRTAQSKETGPQQRGGHYSVVADIFFFFDA